MLKLTRRKFGALALVGTLAATASGMTLMPAAAADKINVGILSLTSHSPSIIAEANGYFADEGIEDEFVSFQAAQPRAVAIASGDAVFGMPPLSGGLLRLSDKVA